MVWKSLFKRGDFPPIQLLVKKNGVELAELYFEVLHEEIFIIAHFAGSRSKTVITTICIPADDQWGQKEGLHTGTTSCIAKLADALIEDDSVFGWIRLKRLMHPS